MVCPLAVGLGSSTWLGTAFLDVAALSILAAIPFAVLAAAGQLKWQERNPGKPYPSWRMTVAMWCITASLLLGTLTDRSLPASSQQPYSHGIHQVVWIVESALLAGAFVFLVLATRQWSKVRNNGTPGNSPVGASPRRRDGQ